MDVRSPLAPLLAALVVVGACGGDDAASPGPTGAARVPIRFRPPATGRPGFGDVPFPSDLHREGDHVVPPAGLERLVEKPAVVTAALASLDGFGRSTGAVFLVDEPLDPASLPRTWDESVSEGASAFFVDVDPASPTKGKRYPAKARWLPTLRMLSVIPVPGVVLSKGARHAAVVTSRARTAAGVPLGPDAPLVAIARGDRAGEAGALYGAALDTLVATGAVSTVDDVAGLAVFTTSRAVDELPKLRDALRQLPAPNLILSPEGASPYTAVVFGRLGEPTLDAWLGTPEKDETGREWPGGDNPGGIAHDAVGAVASGAFVAPSLLDPGSKHFEPGPTAGYRVVDAGARIPVTLVVPKDPPPPSGYPVVVSGHGLSNNRGSMLSFANELCRAGFAVIGIDDVLHGARGGLGDQKNNYPGSFVGPDGIPDKQEFPVAFFAGFTDFVAVRDNFRQTVLDQTSLVRLVENPALDLSPLAPRLGFSPKLDGSRLYWSGGSLGGIVGAMTVAVEPDFRGAALQVPGAGFVQLISTGSAKISPLVGLVARGNFGLVGDEPLDEHHPLGLLLAAATEAGDPIAYAPHVLRDPLNGRAPPDLLVTYAAHDEVLPNLATSALVRALGLPVADAARKELPGVPVVPSPVGPGATGRVGVAVAYDPANHGLGYVRFDVREFLPDVPRDAEPRFPRLDHAVHFEMPIREHADQLVGFLTSSLAGSPVVTVTAPPREDFDGDGVLDAEDPAPFDPATK